MINRMQASPFRSKGNHIFRYRLVSPGDFILYISSVELAKDKLFPKGLLSPSVANTVSAAWQRSTIFGPLFVTFFAIFHNEN